MYSSLTLVGNVGRDPEMRYTPTGQPVTSFSVAENRQYTAQNGEVVKDTVWYNVITWGKKAEVCNQYVKKGMKVLVEGQLVADKNTHGPRTWTAQDGSPRAAFELKASTVKFLSSRSETGSGQNGGAPNSFDDDMIPAGGSYVTPPEEDIPF